MNSYKGINLDGDKLIFIKIPSKKSTDEKYIKQLKDHLNKVQIEALKINIKIMFFIHSDPLEIKEINLS